MTSRQYCVSEVLTFYGSVSVFVSVWFGVTLSLCLSLCVFIFGVCFLFVCVFSLFRGVQTTAVPSAPELASQKAAGTHEWRESTGKQVWCVKDIQSKRIKTALPTVRHCCTCLSLIICMPLGQSLAGL